MGENENTKRKPCHTHNCESEYQDKKYGKGIRVHNRCGGPDRKTDSWRCTVCGNKN